MNTTELKVIEQGSTELVNEFGHSLIREKRLACFSLDFLQYTVVSTTGFSDNGYPRLFVRSENGQNTVIEFSEFLNWHIHSASNGNTVSVSLINMDPEINLITPGNDHDYCFINF